MSHQPLRIGIDLAATVGQKSGLGFYVENLYTELQKLEADADVHFVPIDRVQKNLRTPYRIAWDQVGLPLTALSRGVDMLFVPAFSAPRFFPKPVVMTAHDVFGLRYPEQFSGVANTYWTKVLPDSMKRVSHLVAISEFTKQEVMTHLQISEENITVVPNAAAPYYRLLDDSEAAATRIRKLGVRAPFIVTTGTIEPRKNYERLIDAFAFSKRGDHQLVIVGKKGWKYDELFKKVRKYHLEDAVKFVDYVENEDIVALYNACTFFIAPSLYEGFGLPALEAMQCGAAVMVSQNTSLPEVVGDAGVLFDPFDSDDMRKRMDLLFGDVNLRRAMQVESTARATQFSWKKTAQQTLDVLRRVYEQTKK